MQTKHLIFVLLSLAALPDVVAAPIEGRPPMDPKLDPKRIINRSANFLKEREPDLTAEENALYDHVNMMLTTQPALGLKLLEGLGGKAGAKEPASPAFDLLLGNVYYAAGQIDKAEAKYQTAIDRYPSYQRAWTNLGVLHYAQQNYAKAIPSLAKAVELGNRESTTFGMMAICLEQTRDAVGAELAFLQALAADPGNVSWMDGLVRVYLEAKQYARAEVMVRNLIKVQPTESRYWLIYAKIMVAADRKLEAIALLEQTLSTGIAGDGELAELAALYAEERLIPEAVRTYGKIKVTAKALGERRALQLVRVLTASAEWEKAHALLEELSKLGAEDRAAFLRTEADLLVAQKKWSAARKVLDELLRLNPMDGSALVSLGRTYAAEGDVVHATLAFETAAQTKEGAHQASLALANIELKHRHYRQSVFYLENALSIERNQDVEDILTRVRSLLSSEEKTEA